MTKGALLIVLNHKKEILLQHKDAGALMHANHWCLFGGGIEPGETSEMTVKREFKEELEWTIRRVTHLKDYADNDVFIMHTEKSADELRLKLHEGNDVRYFALSELDDIEMAEPHKQVIIDYFKSKPERILFICRGNAYRSIIAETYTKSLGIKNIEVMSRGTVARANKEANIQRFAETQALMERHDLLSFAKKQHAQQLTQQDIDHSDLVVCVNDHVFDSCPVNFVLPHNTITWDIADIGDPNNIPRDHHELIEIQERTFNKIQHAVDQLPLLQ